jgi:hypothetical protein
MISELANSSELANPAIFSSSSLPTTMAQPNTTQLPCKEADIILAILALKQGQFRSARQAAATYNVPKSTLLDRLAGKPTRCDCQPNSLKVTPLEEEVVTRYILDLDSRGFPPSLDNVQVMANKLLADRSAKLVGIR